MHSIVQISLSLKSSAEGFSLQRFLRALPAKPGLAATMVLPGGTEGEAETLRQAGLGVAVAALLDFQYLTKLEVEGVLILELAEGLFATVAASLRRLDITSDASLIGSQLGKMSKLDQLDST